MPEITENNRTIDRLARIETTLGNIQKDQEGLRTWLANVLAEMRTATSAVQGQANNRDVFCAARNSGFEVMVDRVKDHEERLDNVEKLMPALRVVIWIGAALGVSVLALIWSMITGQVVLVFPS